MPSTTVKLSRREREIMDALFAIGADASVEDIRERLTDTPSYSAVRAMLVKLETKGHVTHRADGARYLYAPTVSRAKARRTALQRLVGVFFAGSASEAATALLKHEQWTNEELDALANDILEVRKRNKR